MSTENQKSDLELIRQFQSGDVTGFDTIVLRYQDRIYNLCRQLLGNPADAQDAAQDVFVKAYRNLTSFQPNAALYTWLYRIAVNTCIDYKRRPFFDSLFKRTADGEEVALDPASDAPSPERLAASAQSDRALRLALSALSPKLRAAVVLREIEGLSYEEIADVLKLSLGTVKSRIARAREELLQKLEHHRTGT